MSVGCTVVCALLVMSGWHRLLEIESYSEDLRLQLGRKVPADPRLVFVGIDQSSYDSYYSDEEKKNDPILGLISKNWPWSREVWAIAIERLIGGRGAGGGTRSDLHKPRPRGRSTACRGGKIP